MPEGETVRISMLASGSGGNSLLVETPCARVLVDAGLPPNILERRLSEAGVVLELADLSGVCLTHEHSDHAAHASVFADLDVAIWSTRGTLEAARLPIQHHLRPGLPRQLGADLAVLAVPIPHDARQPCGFIFSAPRGRFGFLTDLGRADRRVAECFRGLDALVLECNHDPAMLDAGVYPRWLKRRVAGPLGHLSNQEAAALLAAIGPPWPKVIVLSHLSANNNRPELAEQAIRHVVGPGTALLIARQAQALPSFELGGEGPFLHEKPVPRQLALFSDLALAPRSRIEPVHA